MAFYLNTHFVFDLSVSWHKLFQYALIYIFQYITGLFLIVLLVDILEIDGRLAPLINVVLLTPITFLMNRRFFAGKSGGASVIPRHSEN